MPVPNIFGSATSAIPLSQLDTNFATPVTIGNTAVQLGNTVTSFGNVTLTNVTISSGNVTITGANVSGTANVSTLIITGNQTSLGNVSITGNVSANIATFGAGSNTAPAITTTGDTNTGIFFPAADTIAFTEGGVESMRINSSGNVGIGLTPNAWSGSVVLQMTGPSLWGSTGVTHLSTNTYFDGTNYKYIASDYATDYYQLSGTHVWRTAASGTAGNNVTFTESMRIDSSGFLMGAGNTSSTNFGLNWGGGKTTTAFNCAQIAGAFMGASGSGGGVDYPYVGYGFYTTSTNGTYKYSGADVVSAIRYSGTIQTFTAVSGTAGNNISWVTGPYVANSGTSWTNSSDERLKNITGEITDAINKVSQLRAAEFTWKSDESNKPQVGLIAQDLQKVLPEVVVVPEKEFDGTAETAIGVNYDQVIPLLVAAIKEQQAIIVTMREELDVLKAKVGA